MTPSIGRIVLYMLNEHDVGEINNRRGDSPADVSTVVAGQEYPMLIVRVWSDSYVNGQVFLDGCDSYWTTSRNQVPPDVSDDQKQGKWYAPPRVG